MDIFSIFLNMKVCCVFSLESPHRGDSSEYTQYTSFNIKMKIILYYPKSAAMGFFLRGSKLVRNSRGKRAISVRAIGVLLYVVPSILDVSNTDISKYLIPKYAVGTHPRDGRVVRWCCVNFQCPGVLLIWIRVGQGPSALAVGAGGGCLDTFLSSVFSLLFLPLS